MDGISVSLQNSYDEILTPKVMVLRGGVFGRWLGQGGGVLMIGISVLIYNWEASLPLLPYEDTVTKCPSVNQEKGCHQTIDLGLPSLQNYEK